MCLYCYLLDMKDEIEDDLDEIVELRYEAVLSHRYFSASSVTGRREKLIGGELICPMMMRME